MTPIAKIMKMHARDKFSWYLLPWIILSSSFIINLIISFFVETPIYTGGIGSIYVYMFVAGIIVAAQTFPFALGFSVRRTDFFLGTMGFAILISAVNTLFLLLFSFIERQTSWWGSDLHFFNLPYLNDGGAAVQFWIHFSIFMNLFLSGFLINCIYRRIGRSGLFIFFTGVFAIITVGSYICTYNNWWVGIINWIIGHTAFELSLWLFPFIAAYALISYLLLRRATV
jgi:hypothetical protein